MWRWRDRTVEVGDRVLVMGVVNVTPDSFSDGGRFIEPAAAIAQARRLLDEGADLIDLGAESTRPGAAPVPAAEQLRRLMPVLDAVVATGAAVSVDTASAEVARASLAA
ncbi:MAG TPA: dihydropteroate synthase, partial [Dongiaceae bacterium]|nr:dihydropteroate synthase [Dongiaceae bacterium]